MGLKNAADGRPGPGELLGVDRLSNCRSEYMRRTVPPQEKPNDPAAILSEGCVLR